MIEADFTECCKYVEPVQKNSHTHSIEFYRLHQDICREIDSLFKFLLREYHKWPEDLENPRINDYLPLKDELGLGWQEVWTTNHEFKVKPFEDWEEHKAPDWWTAHNNLKHDIAEYFENANLCNVVCSLAALYLLLNHPKVVTSQPIRTKVFVPKW